MPARPDRFRHQSTLENDILASAPLRTTPKKRKTRKDEDEGGEGFVDSRSSRKILKIGQELEQEDIESSQASKAKNAFAFESRYSEDQEHDEGDQYDDDEAWGDEEEIEVTEVNPDDLDLFNKFLPGEGVPTLKLKADLPTNEESTLELEANPPAEEEQGTNLTALILEKIAAHEAQESGQTPAITDNLSEDAVEIPTKILDVYTKVGLLMSRWKSGKIPKPLKILPTLPQWEDLLMATSPEAWTPNACLAITRIFISGSKKVARRFLEIVILDRVREEIRETKKLNVHLFQALQKAAFKPECLFKGFLFPLIESGCSLREARVIAAVLNRSSIPALHSAAAIMRLTELAAEEASTASESIGSATLFIKAMVEKGYALPYQVIDALVFHFLRFRPAGQAGIDAMDEGPISSDQKKTKLPVLFNQTLLVFSQKYRNDITEEQREALLDLLLNRGHKDIAPEIRKELLAGRGRGVPIPENEQDGGDDTMIIDTS